MSSAPEVLRGLGYWFFYGDDKLGPWTAPSATYTTNLAALSLSYLVPILAMVAAALVRWRYRALFLALTVMGAFTAIAAFPWSNPSLLGATFKAFTRTDAGLALRSTPRAVPLVILGLALFLGAGVTALGRRVRPHASVGLTAVAAVVVFANMSTLWTGQMVAANLERPENIPSYWQQAANYLQAQGSSTRVLEVPGSDFASYRWGNTVDPVTPGLMTRPVRGPRAVPVRLGPVGLAAGCLRHPLRRGRPGSPGHRPHRPAHGGGRRGRPQRPAVRALPHGPTGAHVGSAHPHPGHPAGRGVRG